MSQNPKPPIGPEHSREREFTAVLEDLQSQFRVFGEGLADVQEKVSDISQKLEKVETDVSLIKSVLPSLATKQDIQKLENRLIAVESR